MGIWKGWYEQNGQKHEMKFKHMKVKKGQVWGGGQDPVGGFEVKGLHNLENHDVHFIKQYHGAHQVVYKGKREGKEIKGNWELAGMTGGFYLFVSIERLNSSREHPLDSFTQFSSGAFSSFLLGCTTFPIFLRFITYFL